MTTSTPGRIKVGSLDISKPLFDMIEEKVAPGTNLSPGRFWNEMENLLSEMAPRNRELLDKRDRLQAKIDAWHLERKGRPHDPSEYKQFLFDIGYLVPEGEDFTITTAPVDPEIAFIAGPQLVVPVTNPRYALNAVNARWGSLYDALYGSDLLPETDGRDRGTGYNPVRGARVVAYAAGFLDEAVPLARGSHGDVVEYRLTGEGGGRGIEMSLADGTRTGPANPAQFAGFVGEPELSAVLFVNNGLHLEIRIDRGNPIGKDHPAGVADVLLEAAVTTICDCEDSVAAVDGEDKALTYANWLGLIKGDLTTCFRKKGQLVERGLNPDRIFTAPDGKPKTLSGRSLMLIRNVGHLMTTDAVRKEGREVPEGILDITDVGLMEDRATLRISSQYLANWILHGIVTKEQVLETLERMAAVVDRQNQGDPAYRPMSEDLSGSIAFQAACDLIFKGREQPNGYTEPILHARRRQAKRRFGA